MGTNNIQTACGVVSGPTQMIRFIDKFKDKFFNRFVKNQLNPMIESIRSNLLIFPSENVGLCIHN